MMMNLLKKEFSQAYRGGIASYLTQQEAVNLYTSVLLHKKKDLNEQDVRDFIASELNELRQLDERTSIIQWLS